MNFEEMTIKAERLHNTIFAIYAAANSGFATADEFLPALVLAEESLGDLVREMRKAADAGKPVKVI